MRNFFVALVAGSLWVSSALGQTTMSLSEGETWTPIQWMAFMASKADFSGALSTTTSGIYGDTSTSPAGIGFAVNGSSRLLFNDSEPVNSTNNPGLAPTYFGFGTWRSKGSTRTTGHWEITGNTRGWEGGTCLLAINANQPANAAGCGQGGYYDMGARSVYPGQDTEAASMFITGITPVLTNGAVQSLGSVTVTNLAGINQTIGSITLSAPLTAPQIFAINNSDGPMRVQLSNQYFGYTVPPGLTASGSPITAASADGTTIYVDNWTRAVNSPDLTPAGTCPAAPAGHVAACPTFAWVAGPSNGNNVAGTGILPTSVGQTNGSAPLSSYTVTIDVNYLAEDIYGGFHVSNSDMVNTARMFEFVGVMNKTGTVTWNETEVLNDQLNGNNFMSQTFYAGCQNDDGVGLGFCGSFALVGQGIKRGLVCENPQNSIAIGHTECVLDAGSGIGYYSTKSSGYAMIIDPGANLSSGGSARFLLDYNGNIGSQGNASFGGNVTVGTAGNNNIFSLNSVMRSTWSVSNAPFFEVVGTVDQGGTPTWNDTNVLADELNGTNFSSRALSAYCGGAGLGLCGTFGFVGNNFKRGIVCQNAVSSSAEGNTECVLDVSSGIGYYSTKSSGYAMIIDPGANLSSGGSARFLLDYNGNIGSQGNASFAGNVTVGTAGNNNVLAVNGQLTVSGFFNAESIGMSNPLGLPSYSLASLPSSCGVGTMAYATDGRNLGEGSGAGTGTVVFCNKNHLWYAYGSPVAN